MKTLVDFIIVLIPFVLLFSGFLVFRLGALKSCLYTLMVEFIIVWTYYRMPVLSSFESAIWGNIVIWSGLTLIWAGQMFGYIYRRTGLMQILLDSIESIFPRENREGRAITLIAPLSGLLSNLHGFAAYPLVFPGLVDLGFDPVGAASATLVYMSWEIGFGGLFIGAIIANAATHIPIEQIAHAQGIFGIPLVPICLYAAFKMLGFKFWKLESQILYWTVAISYILGIVLFVEVWPSLYLLNLFAGTGFAIAGLAIYGSWQRRHGAFVKRGADAAAKDARASTASGAAAAEPPSYPKSMLIRAYGPLAVAVVYILLQMVPAYRSLLQHVQFRFGAWGYSPITVQFFTQPTFIILLAAFSSYVFAAKRGNNPIKDTAAGTWDSRSALATMCLSACIMFLMVDTGQLSFLGSELADCGRIGYQFLDAAVCVLGGTIFGAGTPAVFAFARMQLPAAASLHLPVVLLEGMVVLGALGCTNALKPPNIRFLGTLVGLDASADNDIFRKGAAWSCIEALVLALTLLAVSPFWAP